MSHRTIVALCLGAFAASSLAMAGAGDAGRAPAAQARAAPPDNERPTPRPPDREPADAKQPADALPASNLHDLELRYATVYLKLAELDLQKLLNLQKRVSGAISSSQIDRVDGLVRVAQDNLRLIDEGKASRSALNLARAKEAVRTAEQVFKTAQQVSRSTTGAISEIDLDRARLTVDLERLSLAKAEAAAASDSPLDDLQWELDQMRDDMQRLRYRIEAITARR
ncbi:MAG: hypothetical protein HYX69_16260 [Planctomycetia bacterium]|nr:hypothetical protein [Planctomycetia bacterium]